MVKNTPLLIYYEKKTLLVGRKNMTYKTSGQGQRAPLRLGMQGSGHWPVSSKVRDHFSNISVKDHKP
jgi:hypothetical protein